MTREEIVAFFDRRQAAVSSLDPVAAASLHSEDGVVESPLAGGAAQGREAIEHVYRAFFAAFSTASIRQEQLLIDDQRAVLVVHIDGTDSGGLMGMAPTGRPFSLSLVSLCELRDGLIARERRIYDYTGLLIQIGAVKVKPI